MAYAESVPVGFFNIRFQSDKDPIQLTDERCGLLDPLGAYVVADFRRRGVGTALLSACLEWAREQGLERVHVDFETANRLGKRFWLEHFRPCLTSVRRSVNADARA
jgi:GNAT superfamily N-acetyltransferase